MIKMVANKFKVLAFLFATLLVSNSCSDLLNNPLQDKETGENVALLLLDLDVFDTKIFVHLIDEETGGYVTESLNVYFEGEDVDKLVDVQGNKNTVFTVSSGILEIALDPNFNPTQENPLDFFVTAESDEVKWFSFPEEVSITENGQYNINVYMQYVDADDDDVEDVEEDFELSAFSPFSPQLKSASTISNTPPFTASIKGFKKGKKKTYSPAIVSGATEYYFYIYNSPSATVSPSLSITTAFRGDAQLYNDWGYNGSYKNGNSRVTIPSSTFARSGQYTNVNSVRFKFGAKRTNFVKCSNGLRVNIKESSASKGSSEFDYVLKTKGGVILKRGKVAGSFSSLNNYTISTTISPIYYPNNDQEVVLELSTFGTYTLDKQSVEFGTPCGQVAAFVATPKPNLQEYVITTTLSCQSGGVGAAPSMRGTVAGPGLEGKTPFNFSGGTVSLYLMPNSDYTIEGTYADVTASFNLTTKTDQASINSVIQSSKNAFPELYDLTIKRTGNKIEIGVIFTTADCPF